jgi:hypothetical protein
MRGFLPHPKAMTLVALSPTSALVSNNNQRIDLFLFSNPFNLKF